MKLDDHLNDRLAFESAMFRARMKAEEQGLNPTFREMLGLAQKELEAEHARLAGEIKASASSPSPPATAESPQTAPTPETEPPA